MTRLSLSYFLIAALCGTVGMAWGLWMGATEQMVSYPAHAHLNALGFLGLSAMGAFYGLAGERASQRLARINLWLSALGAIVMPIGIAIIVTGRTWAIPIGILGGFLAIGGMLVFLVAVYQVWKRA